MAEAGPSNGSSASAPKRPASDVDLTEDGRNTEQDGSSPKRIKRESPSVADPAPPAETPVDMDKVEFILRWTKDDEIRPILQAPYNDFPELMDKMDQFGKARWKMYNIWDSDEGVNYSALALSKLLVCQLLEDPSTKEQAAKAILRAGNKHNKKVCIRYLDSLKASEAYPYGTHRKPKDSRLGARVSRGQRLLKELEPLQKFAMMDQSVRKTVVYLISQLVPILDLQKQHYLEDFTAALQFLDELDKALLAFLPTFRRAAEKHSREYSSHFQPWDVSDTHEALACTKSDCPESIEHNVFPKCLVLLNAWELEQLNSPGHYFDMTDIRLYKDFENPQAEMERQKTEWESRTAWEMF